MNLNLRTNTLWSLIEVIGSSLTLFFLYKIVVGHLGIEALGIWSLVLATTSLGRLADIGTAAGLGRFVAAANANNDREKLVNYAETAILTNFMLYTGVALIIWLPAYHGLSLVMNPEALAKGRELLPFSLISFVLMSLVSATTGSIVGQHHSDQKSKISLAGFVVQFSIAAILVPHFGLPALAWAQIAQYALIIGAGWFCFLRNHYGKWTLRFPVHWSVSALKELLRFGIKLQAISIAQMFFDPIVKFIMSSMGGLESLGYFEMAQRLILQVRQLLIMPIQTLVPSFAHFSETEPSKISGLCHRATAIAISLGFILLGGIAATSPFISLIWIGHMENGFIIMVIIMSIGWFINLITAPAYLMGIGIGKVKGNLYGAIVSTGGVMFVSFIFGRFLGGYGVAMASSLMLASAGVLTMYMNCRAVNMKPWPPKDHFLNLWRAAITLDLNMLKP